MSMQKLTLAAAAAVAALSTGPAPAWAQPYGSGSWSGPGADLAAVGIRFQLVQKHAHPHKGRVRITGLVTNVGGPPFRGNAAAALWQWNGSRWDRVAYRPIGYLPRGAVVAVSFDRDWFAPNLGPGAAMIGLPKYAVTVGVGPDSSDANPANNQYHRDGAGLNALFHPLVLRYDPRSRFNHPRYREGFQQR